MHRLSEGLYLNLPGRGEEGDRRVRGAYGRTYHRRARIKAEYDPDNVFRMNRNIEPAR